jgi:hypothetical protein
MGNRLQRFWGYVATRHTRPQGRLRSIHWNDLNKKPAAEENARLELRKSILIA